VSCRIILSETVTRTGNGVGIVAGMKRGAIRGIQYAAAFRFRHGRCGPLDRPLEPVIGRRIAPTRWRAMTTGSVARSPSKLPRVQLSNSLLLRRHSFAISPRIHASFAINVLPT
jgi:hypothetical protein